MTPEGKIKRMLDAELKRLGVWYFCPQAGPYGSRGIPDRVVIVRGLFVGIECKASPTHKPTALQAKCMKDIESAGGMCFLVYDRATVDNAAYNIELIMLNGWKSEQSNAV